MKTVAVKTKMIVFLAGFAVFLCAKNQDTALLFTAVVAILSACAADAIYSCFKYRKLIFSGSSVISALIIGFVLAGDTRWWIIAAASFCAILSKHLIRFNNRHIFNPAAFGIFLSIIFLGADTQWSGTFIWYILVPAGLYFTYKVRKTELTAGYLITALVIFGVQAALNRVPLPNIFGYLSYFYIFIMLIEPKTTPVKPPGKVLFGIAAACLIFIFVQAEARFDAELAALLLCNLAVPFLNKIPERRKR